jgi:hypothetical protein
MIFTTYWFLFFALLAVAVYRALPRPQWRLAAACAAFHIHFGGPAGVLPIIALMVITYFAGRTRDRAVCAWAMAACVAALCFYKYALSLIGAPAAPLSADLRRCSPEGRPPSCPAPRRSA